MPTYVYECKTCENVFEIEQRITEDALKDCNCGSKGSLRRLIQPVGVVFNGSGFHINDYASSASKTDFAKDHAAPAKDTKPDTKPETPAPSSPPESSPKSAE